MKKQIPTIAGGLLGLAFITFGLNHFLGFMEAGGSGKPSAAQIAFFTAIGPTGFLTFVKVLEIIGGVLTAVPKTRNIGLLILGPIVVNILAINILIIGGSAVFAPPVLIISALSAYLLWSARSKFLNLLND